MSKVKNENYINIQGWMINKLNLSGNDLLVYAIIYGFSQAENQNYTGGLQYLADWTNSTKRGIQKNIENLLNRKLIVKIEKYINNVKFCEYSVSEFAGIEQSSIGIEQSSTGGIEQSSTNNIALNKLENNKHTSGAQKQPFTEKGFSFQDENEYLVKVREIYGVNILHNESRWLNQIIIAEKNNFTVNQFTESLQTLLADKSRKYPVTPENVVSRLIDLRAKENHKPSFNTTVQDYTERLYG